MPILALLLLAGCGSSKVSDPVTIKPAGDASTDAGGESDPLGAVAGTEESTLSTSEPSGDKPITGGIQLPDSGVPAEDDSETQGSEANEGGIVMPDLMMMPDLNDSGELNDDQAQEIVAFADWSSIQSFATSTGKVTVVDLWSLACGPCLKEFPGLVKLNRDHGSDVICVGVSVDYDGRKSRPADSYKDRVVTFLKAVDAAFPNFICQTPNEDVYNALDLDSIPAVLVFDQQGKLQKRFVDAGETIGFGYEKDVVPFVEELLKQDAAG